MSSPAHSAFRAVLQGFAPKVATSALAALVAKVRPRVFAKDQFLLRTGERATWIYFLTSGMAREFYLGADGSEHTVSFVAQGTFTGSLVDLLSQQPALRSIQTLERTETLAFLHREFDDLCEQHADLQRLARRLAEAVYVRKARREYEMLALSAADRYRGWLAENAALDARLSRRQVAGYLGITPEHLSRLRHLRRGETVLVPGGSGRSAD